MPWVTIEPAVLERTGESEVIAALDRDDEWITHDGRRRIAEGWLRSKDSARRDAREEATISLAKAANRHALYATIIAIIGIIISAKSEIYALILMLTP